MVKIKKDNKIILVTNGAYENTFKGQGYTLVEEIPKVETQEPEINEEINAIMSKPFSEWSKKELKMVADENSIDLSGTKTVEEARELVKTALGLQ